MEQAKAVVPAAGGVRRMGAAALDLAYVAAGRYDGFWENICHPWDVAAGVLLVSEAAGQVSHLNGKKYVLGSTDIVATNGLLHAPLLKLISPKKTVKAAG